jgi:hypothetical protein
MKTLYESILSSTKSGLQAFIGLKMDKFSQSYLTEEQWKYIAAYVKSKFPQLYEMTATKGDGYNFDREQNKGRVNDRPNVDIRFKYTKYKVNQSNNLRVISYIMSAIRNIQGGVLNGADRLEHSHQAGPGIYNLHYSEKKRDLRDPKPSDITAEIQTIMNSIKIEII